jgi:retron-type reverse transcriptase
MATDEKAALYKQLVGQADPWLVLERMRELGFWPEDEDIPEEPPAAAKERARLEDELVRLRSKGTKIGDPDAALQKERIRRWQESKKRRAIARAERIAEQKKRAEAWATWRAVSFVHAGEGVSGGLEERDSALDRLGARDLPVLSRPEEIAAAMGIELARLRWLTFHRRTVSLVHYHRYFIAKKTGGVRHISAPKPALARAQEWVLREILQRVQPEPEAHGFVRARSIRTNALAHVGRTVVVNLDLKDFFPSVGFRRVKGLFARLGYSESVATVLALLCTEPPRVEAELDGRVYHVALGERVLPQGACTSPAITNCVCRRLDRRLRGLARSMGFAYTRYADDLTFSGDDPERLAALLGAVRRIVGEEGFAENRDKTRVMRRGRRQEVTGLTVNDRVGLSRRERRRLRAVLHNVARNGLAAENRGEHPRFREYLRGMVAYVCMVDPDNAAKWRRALNQALARPA